MIIKYDNKAIKYTSKWISVDSAPVPPTIYQVYTSGTHGSVTALPSSGISGTEVTLTNTPDTGYQFDSYTVNGATLKNANQFDIGNSDVYVQGNFTVSYNPLNLPANTVRVRTSDGNAPNGNYSSYETATKVTGTNDVYDVYKSGTTLELLLANSSNVVEVLGANTTGITNMMYMFSYCNNLTTVPLFDTSSVTDMSDMFEGCTGLTTVALFDTSSVTNMSGMFHNCSSLTSAPLFDTSSATKMGGMFDSCSSLTTIPLFDTSSATNINSMFYNCTNVQSGALALYQQASTQTTPPSNHGSTFRNCGSNTTTGAAELAQIPSGWK